MKQVGELFVNLGLKINDFMNNLKQARQQAQQTTDQIEKYTRDANGRLRDANGRFVSEGNKGLAGLSAGFRQLAVDIGQAYLAYQAFQTVKLGVTLNADLERAQASFETLLKNETEAMAMLKELQTFAAVTPFEFAGVQKSAKTLLAMGIAAEDILPSMNAIGNAVAAVGGTDEQLQRISLAIGQIQTKGKVSAEEINQLAENGIPAWQILSDKMNLSTQELMKLGEQGKLLSADALPMLLDGLADRYAGGIEKQAQTFSGLLSTFIDSLKLLLVDVTGPLFEGLKLGLKDLMDTFKELQASGDLKKFAEVAGAALKTLFDITVEVGKTIVDIGVKIYENWGGIQGILAGVAAGFAAFSIIMPIVAGFVKLRAAIAGATTLMAAFNLVASLNPIGATVAAIAAAIAIVTALYVNNVGHIQERTKAVVDVILSYWNMIWEGIKFVINLIKLGWLTMAKTVMGAIKGIVEAVGIFSDETEASINESFNNIEAKIEETKGDATKNIGEMTSSAKDFEQAGKDIFKSYDEVDNQFKNFTRPWFANSADPQMVKLVNDAVEARARAERQAVADAKRKAQEDADAKKQAIADAEKRREEAFNKSADWIDQEKELGRMSLTQELTAWERVQKRYAAGTKEQADAAREVARVKIEMAKDAAEKSYDSVKKALAKEKKESEDLVKNKKTAYEKDFENESRILEAKSKARVKALDDQRTALERSKDTQDYTTEQSNLNNDLVKIEAEYNKYKNSVSKQGQDRAADLLKQLNSTKEKIAENEADRLFNLQKQSIDDQIKAEQERYDKEKEARDIQRSERLAAFDKQLEDVELKYADLEQKNEDHYTALLTAAGNYNVSAKIKLSDGQDEILKMLEGKTGGYFNTGETLGNSLQAGLNKALAAAKLKADAQIQAITSAIASVGSGFTPATSAQTSLSPFTNYGAPAYVPTVIIQNMNVRDQTDVKAVGTEITGTSRQVVRSSGVR